VPTRVIHSPVRNPACETEDSTRVGTYQCDIFVAESDPFSATITLEGYEPVTVNVDPRGKGVGEITPIVKDFAVAGTVLRVSGVVRDTLGRPLVGATFVEEQGGEMIVVAETGPDGDYEITRSPGRDQTTGGFSYKLVYRRASLESASVSFDDLVANQMNERDKDWTLDGRFFQFSGRVVNNHAPRLPMEGRRRSPRPSVQRDLQSQQPVGLARLHRHGDDHADGRPDA
jgi:hypothetical protein